MCIALYMLSQVVHLLRFGIVYYKWANISSTFYKRSVSNISVFVFLGAHCRR